VCRLQQHNQSVQHAGLRCPAPQVFVIGGSYSGGVGNKTGEVYSPKGGWRLLPGCPVVPMLTKDLQGEYRSDNHAWL
jgi:galactose oxidase